MEQTGVLTALCLVALIIVPSLLLPRTQTGRLVFGNKSVTNETFVKAAPGAFGSLLAVSATKPLDDSGNC